MDRNVLPVPVPLFAGGSPPARVAWIETWVSRDCLATTYVATREGGVDRNAHVTLDIAGVAVATREGGVDRNAMLKAVSTNRTGSPPARVAWIETSSDLHTLTGNLLSPPARVAWIETYASTFLLWVSFVATREGGVDRND